MSDDELNSNLELSLALLKRAVKTVPQKHDHMMINTKLVKTQSGLLIPVSDFEHRIRFDNFEYGACQALLLLAESVTSRLAAYPNNTLELVAERTLIELGLKKISILFTKLNAEFSKLRHEAKLLETAAEMVPNKKEFHSIKRLLLEELGTNFDHRVCQRSFQSKRHNCAHPQHALQVRLGLGLLQDYLKLGFSLA